MRLSFLILFFTLSLFAIDARFIIEKSNVIKKDNTIVYTIQLAAFPKDKKNIAITFLNNLPKDIQLKSAIYPTGNFFALRYNPSISEDLLYEELKELKGKGFKDSYIVETLLEKFYNAKKSKSIKQPTAHNISKYEYNSLLNKANKYMQNNSIIESIKTYEILFKSQENSEIVNNNLFYLYGKINSWSQAKINMKNTEYQNKLLYAYGIGALENYNQNLENELKEELSKDLSGYVHLILGVFKERQEKYDCAYTYYKAYMKNRFDPFLAFAYARAYELIGKHNLAKKIYKEISTTANDKYIELKTIANKRYKELKELSRIKTKEE